MYKVLLACSIEYNARIIKAMPAWNEATGFEIADVVYSGSEALGKLRESHYDMVIAEIGITEMDGMQLLRHISTEKLCQVSVILSDTVEFEYVRECLLYNAFDYIKKMPDTTTVKDLLARAAEYLASHSGKKEEEDDSRYPGEAADRILEYFENRDKSAIEVFNDTAKKIYEGEERKPLENDVLVKRLYSDSIGKIFNRFSWLHMYISMDYYNKVDYLWAGSTAGIMDFYSRKLSHLYDFVDKMYLHTTDKGICTLIDYILANPQADLRLKTAAESVFLSYSYLSSSFFAKTGLHYNEYIVVVKMSRAAYLLSNTDMKIYEICQEVSYQDTNYFTRQFKKIYGVSPSEYKSMGEADAALDSACL